MEKATGSGRLPRRWPLLVSSLVAHSGGGSYYPYDNSYDLSYYGDVPLVRDVRRNSEHRESLVGLAAGNAARIAGHVLRVPEKNFKCNRSS
jgi:hypothetical protein